VGVSIIERMFLDIDEAINFLQKVVSGLDPEVLAPAFAASLVEKFSRIEHLGAAGKMLAARRVAASGVWRTSGERSPAHWMARQTGASVGQAVASLETAERLAGLAGTDQAMRAGLLSQTQAKEIASAAAASPSSEVELLQTAATEGVAGLRERCVKVKAAAATDESARHDAIQRTRRLRHWTDPEGAFRLDAKLTCEAGAVVLAALEPYKERVFRQARKAGRKEPFEAYAADALVQMAEHSRSCGEDPHKSSPKAMVHVRVDHAALVRGSVCTGETCEIPGVGPIPVATAQALLSDSILSVLVTDGADIKAVCHPGRTIRARVRRALVERDQVCVIPGCNERRFLEIDHIQPFAGRGPTRLDNLARLCGWHHYLKTHQRYRLFGGPGAWAWHPPNLNGAETAPGNLSPLRE